MRKEEILIIGAGGCGNRQLNILMGLDVRFSGVFLNTNLTEMENLEHFDKERRCFYIPNADGCGKDMNKMKVFAKEEAPKFTVMIKKFTQDYIIFLTSANGGTGAMATIMYAKLIKNICPEKSINIVATQPSLSETEIDFENAIDFWNEMIKLKRNGIVDSIQYIDNNKDSETKINIRGMKELNESLSVVNGKIDTSDSKKVHATNGYKVFLKLDKSIQDEKEAINTAIKNTVFYMPDNFDCDKMLIDINSNDYNLNKIREEFDCYGFTKFNENTDGETKVLLSGCEMPKETIELIKEALKEMKNRKRKRVMEEDLIIKKEKIDNNKTQIEPLTKTSKLTSEDLNNMFADDSFWDD